MQTTPEFDAALDRWLGIVSNQSAEYHARSFPTLRGPEFQVQPGSRYVKIVESRGPNDRSVHSFIDKTNGDILKAASWKAPAKHARGNIFSNLTGLDGNGNVAYLR